MPRLTATPGATATTAPGRREVLAPIINVAVLTGGGSAVARITSALPDWCHRYGCGAVTRSGDLVNVDVYNTVPTGTNVACTQIFGTVTNDVPLGTGFATGTLYTVDVNGTRRPFTLR
ncbi:MAG: hypothetical protein EXR66_07715 [Dehalococcoidia bacterium]|nr:hypothetical protein [Dehalococcoidia bacterium]